MAIDTHLQQLLIRPVSIPNAQQAAQHQLNAALKDIRANPDVLADFYQSASEENDRLQAEVHPYPVHCTAGSDVSTYS